MLLAHRGPAPLKICRTRRLLTSEARLHKSRRTNLAKKSVRYRVSSSTREKTSHISTLRCVGASKVPAHCYIAGRHIRDGQLILPRRNAAKMIICTVRLRPPPPRKDPLLGSALGKIRQKKTLGTRLRIMSSQKKKSSFHSPPVHLPDGVRRKRGTGTTFERARTFSPTLEPYQNASQTRKSIAKFGLSRL